MQFSLNSHPREYCFSFKESLLSMSTLTGAPYAKRHLDLAKSAEQKSKIGHRSVAILMCLPVLGIIAALAERITLCFIKKIQTKKVQNDVNLNRFTIIKPFKSESICQIQDIKPNACNASLKQIMPGVKQQEPNRLTSLNSNDSEPKGLNNPITPSAELSIEELKDKSMGNCQVQDITPNAFNNSLKQIMPGVKQQEPNRLTSLNSNDSEPKGLNNPIIPSDQKVKNLFMLIIGGGPTGLAMAIQAQEMGFEAAVLEKREERTRSQYIFLESDTVRNLVDWKVNVPEMDIVSLSGKGVVRINDLETGLERRVNELGIKRISGEFKGFSPNKNEAIIFSKGQTSNIPYDLIVGADGAHSAVREALGIKSHFIGKATGTIVTTKVTSDFSGIAVTDIKRIDNIFVKKVAAPKVTIIFTQNSFGSQNDTTIPAEKVADIAISQNWYPEALEIIEGRAVVYDHIMINLQQAHSFSDEKRSAILMGDAAATGSFFHGLGANTALKTVLGAKRFLSLFKTGRGHSFNSYNSILESLTTRQLQDNDQFFVD